MIHGVYHRAILGTMLVVGATPKRWITQVENAGEIERLGVEMRSIFGGLIMTKNKKITLLTNDGHFVSELTYLQADQV